MESGLLKRLEIFLVLTLRFTALVLSETSCSIMRRLTSVRVENEPLKSWILENATSSYERCWTTCFSTEGCKSFLVDGTRCSLYNTTVWHTQGSGLLLNLGPGVLFYDAERDWFPVFKISTGAGSGFYNLWSGGGSTSNITSCHMTPEILCDSHYKHPMVEMWSQLFIGQVKVALYKAGVEVFSIVFRGQFSDKMSWWESSYMQSFTHSNGWTVTRSNMHLSMNGTGPGFYFTAGSSSPPEGAKESNYFGVWDVREDTEVSLPKSNYRLFPTIVYSVNRTKIHLRDPGLVFHGCCTEDHNRLDFEAGIEKCASQGAELASLEELTAAQAEGMSLCVCGFVKGGNSYYPMTVVHPSCGNCSFRDGAAEIADTFVIFIK